MTSFLGVLQLVLLAGVLFSVLGAGICSLLENVVLRRLERLAPAARARALLGFAAAPALLALVFTAACLLPWLLSPLLPGLDHCQHHGGHPHLCFRHLPSSPGHLEGWLTLSIAAGYLCLQARRGAAALRRAADLVKQLRAAIEPGPAPGTAQIRSSSPLCLAAGLFSPTVVVSSELVARLASDELEAVLAHELAHVARRDALRLAVARALAVFHLPAVAHRLVAELELASELACDDEAARATGDRLLVASAILSVKKVFEGLEGPLSVGLANFGARALDVRIRALVAEPRRDKRGSPVLIGFAMLVVVALLGAEPIHHGTETILSVLTH